MQEVLAMAFDNHCKIIGYETALPLIEEWLNSDCANVRRAVSEGLRIWTSRPYFKDNPFRKSVPTVHFPNFGIFIHFLIFRAI